MIRRLPALWLPLLAALLAGPLVQRPPVWAPQVVGLGDGSGTSLGHALPVSRLQPAQHFRSLLHRPSSHLWPVLRPDEVAPVAALGIVAGSTVRSFGRPTGSAQHFPLFPTGPPSHG